MLKYVLGLASQQTLCGLQGYEKKVKQQLAQHCSSTCSYNFCCACAVFLNIAYSRHYLLINPWVGFIIDRLLQWITSMNAAVVDASKDEHLGALLSGSFASKSPRTHLLTALLWIIDIVFR